MPRHEDLMQGLRQDTSIRDRTRNDYLRTINRALIVCKLQSIVTLLTAPQKHYHKLRDAYSNADTLKNTLTALIAVFTRHQAFANSHARALDAWRGHQRLVNEAIVRRRKNNVATEADVRRMVPLSVLCTAADALDHTTLSLSQDKVLLTFAGHCPAKRADLGNVKVVTSETDTDTSSNFLLLEHGPNAPVLLLLNAYKTSKFYGQHREELPRQVAAVVRASLKAWPRQHLLSVKIGKHKDQPLSNAAYSKRYHEVIHRTTGYDTNINISRHAYISQCTNPLDCTIAQSEEIARKMMHNVSQQRSYAKVVPEYLRTRMP